MDAKNVRDQLWFSLRTEIESKIENFLDSRLKIAIVFVLYE